MNWFKNLAQVAEARKNPATLFGVKNDEGMLGRIGHQVKLDARGAMDVNNPKKEKKDFDASTSFAAEEGKHHPGDVLAVLAAVFGGFAAAGSDSSASAFDVGSAEGTGGLADGAGGTAAADSAPYYLSTDTSGTGAAGGETPYYLSTGTDTAGLDSMAFGGNSATDYSSVSSAWGDNPTGMGDFVNGSSSGGGGGAGSSIWDKILKGTMGFGSLYGLYNGVQQGKAARQQQKDERSYRNQLDELMKNPNSITGMPGYQFGVEQGEQGLLRTSAARGMTGSGGEAAALKRFDQEYAGQFLGQQENLLASRTGHNMPYNAGQDLLSGSLNNLTALEKLLAGSY